MRIAGLCSLMVLLTLTGLGCAKAAVHSPEPEQHRIPQEEAEPARATTADDSAPGPQQGDESATDTPSAEETPALEEWKEQVKAEILAELTKDHPPEGVTASAVGQILWGGEPLEGCRVRVVELQRMGSLGAVRLQDTGQEALTDGDGKYYLKGLTPGSYKLSWVPPGGTHWIRRLRREPDFKVQPGQQTEIEPLDIAASPLN